MVAFFLGLLVTVSASDTYRTETISLQVLEVDQAMALHDRMFGQSGESVIVAGRRPATLVVVDTARRIKAFRALLREIDRGAPGDRIFIRPTVARPASELAAFIDETFALERPLVIADDHAGQIVVRTSRATYARIDRLLRRLDQPLRDTRDIRVTPAPQDGDFPP